jgi:hypothetical protein
VGHDQSDTELAHQLINGGAEMAGSATAAAVGLVVGGPPGALAGAIAGPPLIAAFRRLGADLRQRLLGPREEVRVGAAYIYAAEAITWYSNAGQTPRDDGFFSDRNDDDGRSEGEEILEGVLLHARDAYEERKVRYLGYLFASIAFHKELSAAQANQLLALADRLTYRQLVLLSIFAADEERARLRDGDYREASQSLTSPLISVLTDVYELHGHGLVGFDMPNAMLGVTDVNPRHMVAQGTGGILAAAMMINLIPEEDRGPLRELLAP